MVEKQKCECCEKDAIRFLGRGCGVADVCRDHTDNLLLALKPGEKQVYGECYFELFDTTVY